MRRKCKGVGTSVSSKITKINNFDIIPTQKSKKRIDTGVLVTCLQYLAISTAKVLLNI